MSSSSSRVSFLWFFFTRRLLTKVRRTFFVFFFVRSYQEKQENMVFWNVWTLAYMHKIYHEGFLFQLFVIL